MNMPYLLALDMGTSSIGYVVFGLNDKKEPESVLDIGVRIFSDGRDPKTKEPLAVARRKARGTRRTRDRGQNRVRRLVQELINFGLFPNEPIQRKNVFEKVCPYFARAQAANQPVDKNTLARAIFHIGRRRGFKSNRLSGETEESEYKNKINELREELGDSTLGKYLYLKILENQKHTKNGKPLKQRAVRFRKGETDFYADRKMYEDEFDQIRKVQGNLHLNNEQWTMLRETVFWQYPLKPVPKGKCRFYPEETRAQIDLPITHQFRIYQEVNALKYISKSVEHLLDTRQKQALYKALDSKKSQSFTGMLKLKDEHGNPYFPSDATFNLDVKNRSGKLYGNRVMCDLRKSDYLGALADDLSATELNNIVNYLIEPLGNINGKQVVIQTPALKQWLKKKLPDLSEEQIHKVCNYKFKRDIASVSQKFMEKINPVLKTTGLVYSDAVAQLEKDNGEKFHHSHFIGENYDKLPYYGIAMPESVWGEFSENDRNKLPEERDNNAYLHGKIANPTVHMALNQLRFVVNHVIDNMGAKPEKIHIELTRDLKNSKEARKRIEKAHNKNKKENDEIKKFLKEEFDIDHPHREDIQKIKLWKELGTQGARYCVFTGRSISARQLFNGEVEIEHIVPFSRCYDDGMINKTLAFKNVNNRKANKTPDEAFSGEEYSAILKRALSSFGQGPKFERFSLGAFDKFYGGDKGTMIERQINDTSYITRKAAQYLSSVCANITSVNGRMTAVLRDVWQLNQFKDRKLGNYREDHRHHIVDAFVVGLTSRRLIQQLSSKRSQHEQTEKDLYHFLKRRTEDISHLKAQLMQSLSTVYASYKPDHSNQGTMYKETAYGVQHDSEGNQWCITRKELTSLTYDEIFQIRGKQLKHRIINFLTGGKGIDFESVQQLKDYKKQLKKFVNNERQLAGKLKEFSENTGIKKTRLSLKDSSVETIASAPFKGYALESYSYCDVWKIPYKKDKQTGKWLHKYEGVFMPYAEVAKYKKQPKRPVDKHGKSHPAAKRLMRLYKDDNITLLNSDTGEVEAFRIAGYSASANKLDIRPNLEAVNKHRNFKSINVIFNNYKVSRLRQ